MNTDFTTLVNVMAHEHTDRLATVTDNLVNSATPGYKRSFGPQKVFSEVLGQAIEPTINRIDFSQGPIRTTGKAFDFAINGNGFFVLEKDGAEYYTRNGGFQRATDGGLVTISGLQVQGTNGRISLPDDMDPAQFRITSDGSLYAGKTPVGTLKIVDFETKEYMKRVGPAIFAAPNAAQEKTFTGEIAHRCTEGSNASAFEEMAEMMSTVRMYESCQKMLKAGDEIQGKMINTYAK